VSLTEVIRFRVPTDVREQTESSLRAAGRDGYELFVLWSGRVKGGAFEVMAAHVPRQTSSKTRNGLLVTVEGEALHKMNIWLYEHEQLLGAQVHAHPRKAFHSETDDTYPIVTALGGLSLVAANFCRRGLPHPSSGAYRLTAGGWVEAPLQVVEFA
jgi:hypothetical protein